MSTEAPQFSIIYAGARPEIGYIGRQTTNINGGYRGLGKISWLVEFIIWTHRINGMNGIFIIYLHLYKPICLEIERDKQLQPNSCWLAALGSSLLPLRIFQVVLELPHTKTIAIGMAHSKGDPSQHRFRPYLDRDGWPHTYVVDVWWYL